jgi:ATP-dependent phosphofructokinase / diphosphate-dependent phosphofructokinase
MRLGILTGGGDVPGLNPCIKAVVEGAAARGWEVFGFRRGWAGPLNVHSGDPEGNAKWVGKLTPEGVRTSDRAGGTMLHTSRTDPGRVAADDVPVFLQGRFTADAKTGTTDCTAHVVEALSWLGIDCLIPIGGDDTLSYAARLAQEGVRVVAIPKTMDNDVFGTDYCIGFSTAVTRSVEFIQALRTPAGSHERIAVIELFGRHSGETALIAGYLAGADRTLISEVPVDIDRLARLVRQDRIDNPSHYAVVVVSEGATLDGGTRVEGGEADAYGHLKLGGIGQVIGAEVKARTGIEIINQSLG